MVRTLKDVGPYSDYTYIDYLEEDWVIRDSINYGTTRVARWASPSYPPTPINPFAPEPWTDIFVSEATIWYNKTFSRTCSYESAAIMTLGAAGWWYFQDQSGAMISSIDITWGWRIMNYWCDSWNNYAHFLIECNNPINVDYYFDTSMWLFDKFYIDKNEVPLRTWTTLPNKSCTLTWTVYTPKWVTVQFGSQWSQDIRQQIISWHTCIGWDNMNEFNYMMGDPNTEHLIWIDYYTDWQSWDTIIMPFVTDPSWQPNIILYYCYTSSNLSSGTRTILYDSYYNWAPIHRNWDASYLNGHLNSYWLNINEYYDWIYALANWIDPGRTLPS